MPATAVAAGRSTYDVPPTTSGIEVSAATQGTSEGGSPVTSYPKIIAGESSEGRTDALDVGDDLPAEGK
jgi:hypothetical protein